MEPETSKARVLCTLKFHHKVGPGKLLAVIRDPIPAVLHDQRGPHRVWNCEVTITFNGETHSRLLTQVNWLGAFLLAVQYVHHFIPSGEEQDWVDDEELEVWCILPRCVPFGWGYGLYRKILTLHEETERAFVADVERRRIAREKARGYTTEEPDTGDG